MKVEIREIKPQPPPREVVITLSEEEAGRLEIVLGAARGIWFTGKIKQFVLDFLNKLKETQSK